jgi:hypothetical protein
MAFTCQAELQRWRAHGMAGEVRLADEPTWERLKGEVVVIRDAGYTQVAAGAETVLGIPPRRDRLLLVTELEHLP